MVCGSTCKAAGWFRAFMGSWYLMLPATGPTPWPTTRSIIPFPMLLGLMTNCSTRSLFVCLTTMVMYHLQRHSQSPYMTMAPASYALTSLSREGCWSSMSLLVPVARPKMSPVMRQITMKPVIQAAKPVLSATPALTWKVSFLWLLTQVPMAKILRPGHFP